MIKYVLLSLVLFSAVLHAEVPTSNWSKRFTFAETELGADFTLIDKTTAAIPRLTIGGTHFWGFTDLYVTFPLSAGKDSPASGKTSFYPGVETGIRYFPYRLNKYGISPFIGISWNLMSYQKETFGQMGPELILNQFPVQIGFTAPAPFNGVYEFGGSWWLQNRINYPTSRTQVQTVQLPDHFIWVAYKWYTDTTLPLLSQVPDEAEPPSFLTSNKVKDQYPDSWFVSAGPSSALSLSDSSYNQQVRPYLNDHAFPIFPEICLGYQSYRHDWALQASFRPISSEQTVYGLYQKISRTILSVEAIKFYEDFHGFVPFFGITSGYEKLGLEETDNGSKVTSVIRDYIRVGLVAGWDIRPYKEVPFLLRTTLRYTPFTSFDISEGKALSFNQLEFNFIQAVFYWKSL